MLDLSMMPGPLQELNYRISPQITLLDCLHDSQRDLVSGLDRCDDIKYHNSNGRGGREDILESVGAQDSYKSNYKSLSSASSDFAVSATTIGNDWLGEIPVMP
jgi:hypothetical protein